ncbi:MAG: DUF1343 domain-containing protein [Planctomycetes bacterium]|nr:DUF1343 domain-containing protein [Planctomycetota bacterium]
MSRAPLALLLLALGCAAPPPAPAPPTSGPDAGPVAPVSTVVLTGLDVLVRDGCAPLRGRRVGLVVNHTAIDRQGRHAIDLLVAAPGVTLAALLSPEHGLRGDQDAPVASGVDARTGLPVHSLYGQTRRPTDAMLEGLDTLVFDIQDVGARFYTYISTLGLLLEEAARRGLRVVVLDRPNPTGGHGFDGPLQDPDLVGRFTSFWPMPVTHGMTVGEVARLMNDDLAADLQVIACEGWRRGLLQDETGLPWVNPSPNLRSVDEALLYPMVALTEANHDLSVGRGTDRPFEYVGAPWVDGEGLAAALEARALPGLWFSATTFVPSRRDVTGRENVAYPFAEQVCRGVRVVVTDRRALRPVEAGLHLLDALLRLHPDRYRVDRLRGLIGARWVLEALERGDDPAAIVARWRADPALAAFARARARALLYPEGP